MLYFPSLLQSIFQEPLDRPRRILCIVNGGIDVDCKLLEEWNRRWHNPVMSVVSGRTIKLEMGDDFDRHKFNSKQVLLQRSKSDPTALFLEQDMVDVTTPLPTAEAPPTRKSKRRGKHRGR